MLTTSLLRTEQTSLCFSGGIEQWLRMEVSREVCPIHTLYWESCEGVEGEGVEGEGVK